MPILDVYLTKTEAAQELGVSTRSLDRWHAERIGPPRVKIPGAKRVLYRREAVEAWLLANEQEEPRAAHAAGAAKR